MIAERTIASGMIGVFQIKMGTIKLNPSAPLEPIMEVNERL